MVLWRFRKNDFVFEYNKRYIDVCDGAGVDVAKLWYSSKSALSWRQMSSKWNVIVAVKIYNKDIDKGKSYWQPWLENKSLSSEKKTFQSSQRQFLFAAPTRAIAVRFEPFWSDLPCEIEKQATVGLILKGWTIQALRKHQECSCCLYFGKKTPRHIYQWWHDAELKSTKRKKKNTLQLFKCTPCLSYRSMMAHRSRLTFSNAPVVPFSTACRSAGWSSTKIACMQPWKERWEGGNGVWRK